MKEDLTIKQFLILADAARTTKGNDKVIISPITFRDYEDIAVMVSRGFLQVFKPHTIKEFIITDTGKDTFIFHRDALLKNEGFGGGEAEPGVKE